MVRKLTFTEEEALKLPLAAFLTGCKISNPFKGGGKVYFDVDYKTENDLVSLGRSFEKIKPEEVAQFTEYQRREAEAEKVKEEAKKAKKQGATIPVMEGKKGATK